MKVSDLLAIRVDPFEHKLCEGRVIALDAKDGKILFDTWKNTRKYVERFFSGEVAALSADVCIENSYPTPLMRPCLKCYVTHDSWKGGEE